VDQATAKPSGGPEDMRRSTVPTTKPLILGLKSLVVEFGSQLGGGMIAARAAERTSPARLDVGFPVCHRRRRLGYHLD